MNRIHIYIILYGVLILMVIDTVIIDFPFNNTDPLYIVTNIVMFVFIAVWFLRVLPMVVISSFYRSYVAKLKVQARAKRNNTPYTPFVSVIIPAYNEQIGIVSTVKTLVASTYKHMEVLIVNDGSTDKTEEVLLEFLRKYRHSIKDISSPITLRYYQKTNGGKGSALNYGINKAQGEIICTFDADCVIARDCIERFVSYFVEPSVMALCGTIKIGNQSSFIGTVQHLEYLYSFVQKSAEALLGTIFVIGGAAAAFRKSIFDEIGGYDISMLTEDMELSFRIQQAGMRVFYAHDAIVYTEAPSTWRGLYKQRVRWKHGRLQAMKRYKSLFFSKTVPNRRFFWGVLPFIALQDLQYFAYAIFTIFVFSFCFGAYNYAPILATILLVGALYCLMFIQDKAERTWISFMLAPIGLFLFYFTAIVEIMALARAYWSFWTGRKVVWQKWNRQGVIERP